MKCSGFDAFTGAPVEISFGNRVLDTRPLAHTAAPDCWLAPAWIDLQVNGYAGVDYNHPASPHEEIARSIRTIFAAGVARFYPTVITGSPEDMTGALRNLAAAREALAEGPAMEGFHVEGPYISPEDGPRGAHARRWVRPPDLDEFHRMQDAARGLIRLLTLSPEWPEAPRFIEAVADSGIVVSIGHTKATAAQIGDAIRAGATMSTHLGNGAHALIPRHPNYIWEQLAEDRLTAGFIGDGIHVPACFLKAAIRAKGVERSVLVTDALATAGCRPGRYRVGELEVDLLPDNRCVLAGQTQLAGSALQMYRGIENLMGLAGLTLAQAVTLATLNPARAARIAGRQAGLTAGERADIVQFHFDPDRQCIGIEKTFLDGKLVYEAGQAAKEPH